MAGGLAVRDGSALASMLGMKAGDRMAQANGIALAGIDDILVAFVKPLVASQPVHVAGIRDGKPAAWLFLNAGACPAEAGRSTLLGAAVRRCGQPARAARAGWSMPPSAGQVSGDSCASM